MSYMSSTGSLSGFRSCFLGTTSRGSTASNLTGLEQSKVLSSASRLGRCLHWPRSTSCMHLRAREACICTPTMLNQAKTDANLLRPNISSTLANIDAMKTFERRVQQRDDASKHRI